MSALEEQVSKLSKLQKIGLMERIWCELSSDPSSFKIPDWHKAELERTEGRLAAGAEQFEDWAEVKRELRES